MKKNISLLLVLLLITAVFAGCSAKKGKPEPTINPKFTQGELNGQSISAYYELKGELLYQQAYSLAGGMGTVVVYTQATADGGVVSWANGKYVYSPDYDDINEVKSAMGSIVFKELK